MRARQLPEILNGPAVSGAGALAAAGADGVWHGAAAANRTVIAQTKQKGVSHCRDFITRKFLHGVSELKLQVPAGAEPSAEHL